MKQSGATLHLMFAFFFFCIGTILVLFSLIKEISIEGKCFIIFRLKYRIDTSCDLEIEYHFSEMTKNLSQKVG